MLSIIFGFNELPWKYDKFSEFSKYVCFEFWIVITTNKSLELEISLKTDNNYVFIVFKFCFKPYIPNLFSLTSEQGLSIHFMN